MHPRPSSLIRRIFQLAAILGSAAPLAHANWTKVTGGLPSTLSVEDVEASPDGVLYLTGQSDTEPVLYRSTNGGVNWSQKDSGILNSINIKPGFFRVGAYDGKLLLGTNGAGIFRSSNEGNSWQSASNLTNGSAFYDFAHVSGNTYLATKRENVVGESGIWLSTDGGANWTRRSDGLQPYVYIPGFGGIIPTEDVIVHNGAWFAAINGTGIFRSTNEGLSWQAANNGISVPGGVLNATFVASGAGKLWATVGSMLWSSSDNGNTWTKAAGNFGYYFSGLAVSGNKLYALAYHTNGSRRLFVTADGTNFHYTTDTGLTSGGSVDPIEVADGKAYIATGDGLFTLNLNASPLLSIPPVVLTATGGGTFFTGSNITLTATADGTAPLSYQWKKGSDILSGQNGPTLTLSNVTNADAGTYSVTVTNAGGTATSQNLVIQISTDLPGRFDPAFTAVGFNNGANSANRESINTELIRYIRMQPDGKFWVGGHFLRGFAASVGTADNITLKRGNADGTIDGSTNPTQLTFGTYGSFLEPDGSLVATTFNGDIIRYDASRNRVGSGPLASVRIGTGNARLYKVARLPDGRFFAAGSFDKVTPNGSATPVDRKFIALFNSDGTLDTSFNASVFSGVDLSYAIRSLAYDPDLQKIYVSGNFQNLTGIIHAPKVIRLNMDGSHDTSFATHTSGFFNTEIETIALQPDGKLLIGTRYQATNGPRNLERLLPDGTVDPAFNPGGTGPEGTNRRVLSIELNPDGGILVGGEFSTYNGKVSSIALLDANGVVDPTFNQGGNGPRNNNGSSSVPVSAIATSPDHQWIYFAMGGYTYHTSDGLTAFSFSTTLPQYASANIIRVRNKLSDLSIVKHPVETRVNLGTPATLEVKAFGTSALSYQWYRDGQLLPGKTSATLQISNAQLVDEGYYTVHVISSAGTLVSGEARLLTLAEPRFLVQPPSGTHNIGTPLVITTDVFGQGNITYQWYRNGTAIDGATSPTLTISNPSAFGSGSYYVIATNSLGSTTSAVSSITMNPVGGVPESTFVANIPQTVNGSYGSNISSLLTLADGSVIAAGSFTTAGGSTSNRYLIKLKPDGSVDTTWGGHAKVNAPILRLIRQSDGMFIAAGSFTSYNGTAVNQIVRFDANGVIDPTFTAASRNSTYLADIGLLSSGKIVIAGNFTTAGGHPAPMIALLNTNGSVDTTFSLGGAGPNNNPSLISVQPDDRILITGTFTTFNSQPSKLVRLLPTGSVDGSFNNSLALDGTIFVLRTLADGSILTGGSFTAIGGTSRRSIAKLTPNGLVDPSFFDTTVSTQITGNVQDIVQLPNGRLIISGSLSTWSNTAVRGIVSTDGNGVFDPAFSARVTVTTAYSYGAFNIDRLNGDQLGYLTIAGNFATIGGIPSVGISKLYYDPIHLAVIAHPSDQFLSEGATATFSVTGTGTSEIFYQWFKDGQPLPDQTASTLTVPSVNASDVGDYSVRLLNASGNVFSSAARLRVLGIPEIVTQPDSVVINRGASINLSGSAIGIQPVTYSWLKDGTPVPSANTPTLSVTANTAADAGIYHLVATNALGEARSFPVSVSIQFPNGGIDTTFDTGLSSVNLGTSFQTYRLTPDGSGGFYFVGYTYNSSGGSYFYPGTTSRWVARLNSDGTANPSFTAELTNSSQINDGIVLPNGRLIIGGNNVHYSATTPGNTVRIASLTATGALDTSFVIEGHEFASNRLFALADNSFISLITSYVATGSSRKWNADGTIDTNYTPLVLNSSGSITAAAALPDGALVIAGSFTSINGTPRQRLAVINPDGTLRTSFAPGTVVANNPQSVAILSDGSVLLGGVYNMITGNPPYNWFARFSPNGAIDTGFTPPAYNSSNASVQDIRVLTSGKIAITGRFTLGTSPNQTINVARLNGNGSLDTSFPTGGGLPTELTATLRLAPETAGRFLVTGNFTTIGGATRRLIARYNGDTTPLAVTGAIDEDSVAIGQPFRLSVAATGTSPLAFQWSLDGTPIPGATGPSYGKASAASGDFGTYTVTVTHSGGSDTYSAVLSNSGTPDPTGIIAWAKTYNLTGDNALPGADPDGDGMKNVIEFLLGSNPKQGGANGLFEIDPDPTGTSVFTFKTLKAASAYPFTVETSQDLSFTDGITPDSVTKSAEDATWNYWTVEVTPANPLQGVFLRLKVTY